MINTLSDHAISRLSMVSHGYYHPGTKECGLRQTEVSKNLVDRHRFFNTVI